MSCVNVPPNSLQAAANTSKAFANVQGVRLVPQHAYLFRFSHSPQSQLGARAEQKQALHVPAQLLHFTVESWPQKHQQELAIYFGETGVSLQSPAPPLKIMRGLCNHRLTLQKVTTKSQGSPCPGSISPASLKVYILLLAFIKTSMCGNVSEYGFQRRERTARLEQHQEYLFLLHTSSS